MQISPLCVYGLLTVKKGPKCCSLHSTSFTGVENKGQILCTLTWYRTSFTDVRVEYHPRSSALGLMPCRHHFGTLTNLWARDPAFSFYSEPWKLSCGSCLCNTCSSWLCWSVITSNRTLSTCPLSLQIKESANRLLLLLTKCVFNELLEHYFPSKFTTLIFNKAVKSIPVDF